MPFALFGLYCFERHRRLAFYLLLYNSADLVFFKNLCIQTTICMQP